MNADDMTLCEKVGVALERGESSLRRASKAVREHLQECAHCRKEKARAFAEDVGRDAEDASCWLVMEAFVGAYVSVERLDAHVMKCEACEASIVKLLGLTGGSRCRQLWTLLRAPANRPQRMDLGTSSRVVSLTRMAFVRTVLHAVLTEDSFVAAGARVKNHMVSCPRCSRALGNYHANGGASLEVRQICPLRRRRKRRGVDAPGEPLGRSEGMP